MEYKFKINDFEGPLDLLLHLIKQSEMDITDIEIVKLTDQYVDYIKSMEKLNLNIASEYLVLAANLTYLKSKALLPKQEDDEEVEDDFFESKEELERRIYLYVNLLLFAFFVRILLHYASMQLLYRCFLNN